MKLNWDVTAHLKSEKLVTRTISATTQQVAEAKMRRKFNPRPYSVRGRLAAEQPPTHAQLDAQHREICEKAGVA
jgi:hypothetical protein